MKLNKRILFLDGMRGVAILLVILFHCYSKWASILPYGNAYSEYSIFKYGWLGVNLFFLISGFVILMSLEKSKNLKIFLYKRWLRLFPSMLVISVLIFITAPLLLERPFGKPSIRDLLPGITFIDRFWLELILRSKQGVLEGSFWSLFVEVKFYVTFGIAYFMVGSRRALKLMVLVYFAYAICRIFFIFYPGNTITKDGNVLFTQFGINYFGWFMMGAIAYLYYLERRELYLISFYVLGTIVIGMVALENNCSITAVFYSFAIILIFILPLIKPIFSKIAELKVLTFFGFISYPLYLIHENAIIALIIKIHKGVGAIPMALLPLIPLLFLSLISYLIAKYIEPNVKEKLDYWLLKRRLIQD